MSLFDPLFINQFQFQEKEATPMMTYDEARSELKRMARGEYHSLQTIDYGMTNVLPDEKSSEVLYTVFIFHRDKDGDLISKHGEGHSWEEAIQEFKALNDWWKEEVALFKDAPLTSVDVDIMNKGISDATIKEEEL